MRVLVTFAVEAEFAPWLAARKFRKRVLLPDHYSGGLEVYETECGTNTLWVVLTGMGPNIRPGLFLLGILASQAGVDLAISSGLAGSLRPEHKVGEVIAPRQIGTLRDAAGFSASSGLLKLAGEQGAKIVGTLLTADHIVETSEEKSRLAFWGDAVDMESNRIMQGFAFENFPTVTIRAISDASDEDLPIDFDGCLTPEGKVRPLPLLRRLMVRPSRVPALVRFGRRSKNAATNLIRFLDSFVGAITPQAINSDLGVAAE